MINMKKFRKYIGPSQFATVLNLDEYQTADALKYEIENGYIPNITYATKYGCDNESVGIYYYKKLYNEQVSCAEFVVDPLNSRIGGICDGIINEDMGLEIKCHIKSDNLLKKLPIKFLIQMTGYMYLYNRKKWKLMSFVLNDDMTLKNYIIHDVLWDDVKDRWNREWYPELVKFVTEAHWV